MDLYTGQLSVSLPHKVHCCASGDNNYNVSDHYNYNDIKLSHNYNDIKLSHNYNDIKLSHNDIKLSHNDIKLSHNYNDIICRWCLVFAE